MPAGADPELGLRLAKSTADLYGQAVDELLSIVARRLARGIDQPGWAERKLMEQLGLREDARAVVERLVTLGPDSVRTAVTDGWRRGATQPEPGIAARFGVTNTRAVDAIITETITRLQSMHTQILRATDDMYRSVIAEASSLAVTGTTTTRQAAHQAVARWADQGITGFVDSAGRRWQADTYAEMATRTAVGRAQVAGTLDRFVAAGRDLVIVSDHAGECSACRPFEGRVLTLGGTAPGTALADGATVMATVEEAQEQGLLHANCRHVLGAYIVGLTRPMPKPTADPEGERLRNEQRRLERGVRMWRRRELTALTPVAQRQAAGKVREWRRALKTHVEGNSLKAQPQRTVVRS